MSVRITYSRNPLARQYIIQVIIDDEDLILPGLQPQNSRLSVPDHLLYLAELVTSIDAARQQAEDIMQDLLTTDAEAEEIEAEEIDEGDEDIAEDEKTEDDDDAPFPSDSDYVETDENDDPFEDEEDLNALDENDDAEDDEPDDEE